MKAKTIVLQSRDTVTVTVTVHCLYFCPEVRPQICNSGQGLYIRILPPDGAFTLKPWRQQPSLTVYRYRRVCGLLRTVFVDFAKAFDHVDDNVLVATLVSLVLPDVIVRWICAFLRQRRQRVKIGDVLSDWLQLGQLCGTVFQPISVCWTFHCQCSGNDWKCSCSRITVIVQRLTWRICCVAIFAPYKCH